jgi:hypothetical protein
MVLTMRKGLGILVGAMALIAGAASGQTIGPANDESSATLLGMTMKVATYRPTSCSPRLVLASFHGLTRNGDTNRDATRPLADRLCAVVVSPEFDDVRLPTRKYQRGGVVLRGAFIPPGSRTVDMVAPLIAWARASIGQPDLPYALIGHSAGGQFLARVAAYTRSDAAQIVIANPSTWVLPSTKEATPYGFGKLPDPEQGLRAYLALPITVLLGADDTGTHDLSMEPQALAQGATRLMRGRNSFAMAETVAREHGWTFGWRKAEVLGVGHSTTKMFKSSQAFEAFHD